MIKKLKGESGQSVTEFALILPILIIVLALIMDVGKAVHAKVNLQYLTSEIQKVAVLYDEGGATGGVKDQSRFSSKEKTIETLINNNGTLDPKRLKYEIDLSDIEHRDFTRKIWSANDGGFIGHKNRTDIRYVTVTTTYDVPFSMYITKQVMGETLRLTETYSGLMYIGGDGDANVKVGQ